MAFIKICASSDLASGEVIEAIIDGRPYAVCNVGGDVFCLDGECPCTGGPLGRGAIRHDLLICPWHGWRFDPHTGGCVLGGMGTKLERYPAKQEDDSIFIEVTPSSPSNETALPPKVPRPALPPCESLELP